MSRILFETSPTGVATLTLNHPAALNALDLEMFEAIQKCLDQAIESPEIRVLVLTSSSEKGFCAGGDVKKLAQLGLTPQGPQYIRDFFRTEYTVDYRIHRFPKPVLALAHGITMGGGIGFMTGASHRVLTETTVLAMPEISIGLYPDVGASCFLSRMPGKLGLFIGMTGARFNATDAVQLGLADAVIGQTDRAALLAEVLATQWSESPEQNRTTLTHLVQKTASRSQNAPEASILPLQKQIDALCAGPTAKQLAQSFQKAATDPDFASLHPALKLFLEGSPTSEAIAFEQWNRGKNLSLAEGFRMEYALSLNCLRKRDFYEGVRARLIDKDGRPRWSPDTWDAILPETIRAYFEIPPGEPNALEKLG